MTSDQQDTSAPLIDVRDLTIDIGGKRIVDGVTLSVRPGECVAIVGESGAGKSLTAHSLLGLVPHGAKVSAERFEIHGMDARGFGETQWRAVRGRTVGLVSQDALVALDPIRLIGREVAEGIEVHEPSVSRALVQERVLGLLADVSIPDPYIRAQQYPSELSGGLRQRALIASALAADPPILIADEPTTALDATVQARVLALLAEIKKSGRAIVLVSHDLSVVARMADRIAVMRHGVVLEQGETAAVLSNPQHPYTRSLLDAQPTPREPQAEAGPPVLEAKSLSKSYGRGGELGVIAVRDATISVSAGRTLGIVGESGSGKSTLARMLVGIETPDAGSVTLDGKPFSSLTPSGKRPLRARIQLIDQDSYATFDPRFTVARSLGEALAVHGVARRDRRARAGEALESVGLDASLLGRRRNELSGGQRQRVAIARALIRQPAVLVCDEAVSALDVSVQADILALLTRLQEQLSLALVFISHDLAVIAAMSDDIVVMRDGDIVESGNAAVVLGSPRHPFTVALLESFRGLESDNSAGA
jgi:peptide/nickel transport system ATP-binding protein